MDMFPVSTPEATNVELPPESTPTRNMIKSLIIISLVIVTLMAAISAGLWLLRDEERVCDEFYYVLVEAADTDEYVIRLPVPMNASGMTPPSFAREIEPIEGNAVVALVEYEYGIGLEVRSKGHLEFKWSKHVPGLLGVGFDNLTMTTGIDGDGQSDDVRCWISSDISGIRIRLSYSSIYHVNARGWVSGGGTEFDFDEYIAGTGWQSIPISYSWELIN